MKTRIIKWLALVVFGVSISIFLTSFISSQDSTPSSQVMPTAYLGELRIFAGNFAPVGWAFCDGQMIDITTNVELFSILGTIYGGDGRTTFALPDLRGRSAVHSGQAKQSKEVKMGSKGNLQEGDFTGIGYLGVRYIICTDGVYPKRQ